MHRKNARTVTVLIQRAKRVHRHRRRLSAPISSKFCFPTSSGKRFRAAWRPCWLGVPNWRDDFKPSENTSAQIRSDGNGAYSTSLQGLSNPTGGRDAFHFWWTGMYPRIQIPRDARGIVISTEMRLVSETGTSDASNAKFIGSIGGDLYKNVMVQVDESGINTAMPQSPMRYITPKWQLFYASTMTVEELKANPPPT